MEAPPNPPTDFREWTIHALMALAPAELASLCATVPNDVWEDVNEFVEQLRESWADSIWLRPDGE